MKVPRKPPPQNIKPVYIPSGVYAGVKVAADLMGMSKNNMQRRVQLGLQPDVYEVGGIYLIKVPESPEELEEWEKDG